MLPGSYPAQTPQVQGPFSCRSPSDERLNFLPFTPRNRWWQRATTWWDPPMVPCPPTSVASIRAPLIKGMKGAPYDAIVTAKIFFGLTRGDLVLSHSFLLCSVHPCFTDRSMACNPLTLLPTNT